MTCAAGDASIYLMRASVYLSRQFQSKELPPHPGREKTSSALKEKQLTEHHRVLGYHLQVILCSLEDVSIPLSLLLPNPFYPTNSVGLQKGDREGSGYGGRSRLREKQLPPVSGRFLN